MDGFGLLGMRERTALLHGTLDVDAAPGEGTTITAALPARRLGHEQPALARRTAQAGATRRTTVVLRSPVRVESG